jgi:hypothetical protein
MVEMVEDLKSMQRAAMTKRRGLMLITLKKKKLLTIVAEA